MVDPIVPTFRVLTETSTVEWVTAIGTVAAAVVALFLAVFGDWFYRLIWRPILDIRIEEQPPDCSYIPTNFKTASQAGCCYLRIRVYNIGKVTAESVEVFAESLERKEDGTFKPVRDFLPLNLVWSHFFPPVVYFPKIPPGGEVFKHCDLGHIIDPVVRSRLPAEDGEDHPSLKAYSSKTLMSLSLISRPNSGSHLIPPGVYRLRLGAVAANADLKWKTVEINLTGKWSPKELDMLGREILVKPA
jgi:hypothetical protein